ncbi:MAG TPA: twin-arginine translocase subunit TatC [Xanthomonadaceae bacterium]|jgi:sec-independent protein translocase protein TatC|nr:twin-arginine translocase subunit TatC [Xanthomonadaceae bacterium]
MSAPHDPADLEPAELASGLMAHLLELRLRLMRAVLALGLVFAALLPFANELYALLAEPLLRFLPEGGQLIAIDVASPFFAPLKLALFVALLVAMPFILYQAWAFIAPGLYRHEKRLALPLLLAAVGLFYAGLAFAYFLLLPVMFAFLTATVPEGVAMMTDINAYLSFVLVMGLSAGLAFEVPVAVMIALLLGWVTPAQLSAWRGYVVVVIAIVAALLTPPDGLSMLMLMLPMWLLYEAGLAVGRIVVRARPAAP